jgi:hypothetical protein
MIGAPHAFSPNGSSLDWALVKIDFNALLSAGMAHYGFEDQDYLSRKICRESRIFE